MWVKLEKPITHEQLVSKGDLTQCKPSLLGSFHADNSSEISFDSDYNLSIIDNGGNDNDSLGSPPTKKQKFEDSTPLKKFDKETLRRLILATPNGSDLIIEYDQHQFLATSNRKKLVRLIVNYLVDYKNKIKRTLSSKDKEECAAAVIELFPNLRNPHGKFGFEQFYDPTSGTGYIATGLSNSGRKPRGSKCAKTVQGNLSVAVPDGTTETVEETVNIQEAIKFMQSAVPSQREDIILRIRQTYDVRRFLYMNENFFKVFPRFLDVPELIDVEFKLLFKEITSDIFIQTYPKYIYAALNVYDVEKRDKTILDWDQETNSLICLTQLVPPTAKGKNNPNRAKTKSIIDKLLIFRPVGTPLQVKSSANSTQPKLLAVGPNKNTISQYHISIDNNCISLKVKDIVEAIDLLFKAHYVFNVKFDPDLKNFWVFIQHNFFGIPSTCTNQMIEFYSNLEAAKSKIENSLSNETSIEDLN
ncbi:hypothetical protein KQX54_009045 [Cotesia glomerata]|uniref:Uncharacterized protein n=1 Tax=Cotesia glomerata TaxID=32391 RepID=A0AAV7IM09_COTGL|nr:hypothetical protein KQX54_009045 [Cotesia glomerata]